MDYCNAPYIDLLNCILCERKYNCSILKKESYKKEADKSLNSLLDLHDEEVEYICEHEALAADDFEEFECKWCDSYMCTNYNRERLEEASGVEMLVLAKLDGKLNSAINGIEFTDALKFIHWASSILTLEECTDFVRILETELYRRIGMYSADGLMPIEVYRFIHSEAEFVTRSSSLKEMWMYCGKLEKALYTIKQSITEYATESNNRLKELLYGVNADVSIGIKEQEQIEIVMEKLTKGLHTFGRVKIVEDSLDAISNGILNSDNIIMYMVNKHKKELTEGLDEEEEVTSSISLDMISRLSEIYYCLASDDSE